jgi:hypothetical protein
MPPKTPVINIGSDESPPSNSGSSGGGGSSGPSDAEKKAKIAREKARKLRVKQAKQARRENVRHLQNLLRDFELSPAEFQRLIKQSAGKVTKGGRLVGVIGDSEFLGLVSRNPGFRAQYPGIDSLLETRSMAEAVETWRSYKETLTSTLDQLGLSGAVALDNDRIGRLISGQVSVDEFVNRAGVFARFTQTQEAKNAFNMTLQGIGHAALDDAGWFDFLSGTSTPDLYDIYETTQLESLGFASADAFKLARSLGAPGEISDVTQLPFQLQQLKLEAGQELQAAGLTDQDLVVVALREQLSGELRSAADKASEQVNQILANRAARRQAKGPQGMPSAAGGRPILPSAPREQLESLG